MVKRLTYTLREAAYSMGVSRELVEQLLEENILPEVIVHKNQRRRRVYIEDVEELTKKSRYFNTPKEESRK